MSNKKNKAIDIADISLKVLWYLEWLGLILVILFFIVSLVFGYQMKDMRYGFPVPFHLKINEAVQGINAVGNVAANGGNLSFGAAPDKTIVIGEASGSFMMLRNDTRFITVFFLIAISLIGFAMFITYKLRSVFSNFYITGIFTQQNSSSLLQAAWAVFGFSIYFPLTQLWYAKQFPFEVFNSFGITITPYFQIKIFGLFLALCMMVVAEIIKHGAENYQRNSTN